MRKYLISQGDVVPGMCATAVATLAAPAFMHIFVHKAGLGLVGAATALSLTYLTAAWGLLGYIMWWVTRWI